MQGACRELGRRQGRGQGRNNGFVEHQGLNSNTGSSPTPQAPTIREGLAGAAGNPQAWRGGVRPQRPGVRPGEAVGKDAAGRVGAGGHSASRLGAFQMGLDPFGSPPALAQFLCGQQKWGWVGILPFFFFPLLKGAGEAECGDPREKVPSRVKEAALGSRSKAGHSLRREGSNEDSQEKGARGTQVEDAGG